MYEANPLVNSVRNNGPDMLKRAVDAAESGELPRWIVGRDVGLHCGHAQSTFTSYITEDQEAGCSSFGSAEHVVDSGNT